MNFSIISVIVLNVFLLVVAANEHYLFEKGILFYKDSKRHKWFNKTTQQLQRIDQHILPNAERIKVVAYQIKQLYAGSVKNLGNLKTIAMPDCKIKAISPGAFQNLPRLAHIRLQDNKITVIEENIFNYLPVKELWLHRNDIKAIREGAFDNMPELEIIRLNKNSLTKWESSWFKNTPKLWLVNFRRNLIQELPPRAFVNLRSSHKINATELVDLKIYLSSNRIWRIHPDAFQDLDALEELYLDRNQIRKLEANMFGPLTQVHVLSLRRNKLHEVDKNLFQSFNELLTLELTGNYLNCVPYEVVAQVKVKVDVSGNDLDCECIGYVKDKLKENQISTKIEYDDCEE